MKKTFSVLSVISFMLFALVDFCKNALETYFHIQLMNGKGNFAGIDYLVDAQMCETVLLAIGVVCFALFIVSIFVMKSDSKPSE